MLRDTLSPAGKMHHTHLKVDISTYIVQKHLLTHNVKEAKSTFSRERRIHVSLTRM